MIRLGSRVTAIVKSYWAGGAPPLLVRGSSQDSRPHADLDAVIRTGIISPAVLARHLRDVPLDDSNAGTVKEVQIRRLLKHHPGKRCTLEIGLRTETGWRRLIAKFYHKDRSDVFQAMYGIQHSGFGSSDEFSISQAAGYEPSLHCLLQEIVEGTPADEILKTGDEPSRASATERCAEWLVRFHALAPKEGATSHPKEFVHSKLMQRWSRKIARLDGRLGDKASQLFRRLVDASPSLCDVELKAGHGSFSAPHVYLSDRQTVTIDWDWHDVADPARDVARFLYALRRWALDQFGSIRARDREAKIFLSTYLAAGAQEIKKNLHFFEALTCLNLAVRHLFDADRSWEAEKAKAEVMVDEGLGVLDGETVR
jgi:phosphotransferase family enzyme